MKRPRHLDPPKTLSKSPPLPAPDAQPDAQPDTQPDPRPPPGEEHKLDPTRYGDWEKKGIAVDF